MWELKKKKGIGRKEGGICVKYLVRVWYIIGYCRCDYYWFYRVFKYYRWDVGSSRLRFDNEFCF